LLLALVSALLWRVFAEATDGGQTAAMAIERDPTSNANFSAGAAKQHSATLLAPIARADVGPIAALRGRDTAPGDAAMPPLDAPLAESLRALEALAWAGDAAAATRLYEQAKCCAETDNMAMLVSGITASEQWSNQQDAVNGGAPRVRTEYPNAMKDHLLSLNAYCGKVPTRLFQRLPEYQTLARRTDDPIAILEFVRTDLRRNALPMHEQIAVLNERQSEALNSLSALVACGNLDAVVLLASLHATPALHGDLGKQVEQSWPTTAVYNHFYLYAGGRAYRAQYENFVRLMATRLSPSQMSTAREQAQQLWQRYCANKPFAETAPSGLAPGLAADPAFVPSPRYQGERSCPQRPKVLPFERPAVPAGVAAQR